MEIKLRGLIDGLDVLVRQREARGLSLISNE